MRYGWLLLALVACEAEEIEPGTDTGEPPATGTDTGDGPAADVAYADVAPILDVHCSGCHGDPVANGAPFSLTTFDAASVRAGRIVARAVDGVPSPMPPSGLALSDDESDVLADWGALAGAPE